MALETKITASGLENRPEGEGWRHVHAWENWEGRWWVWHRFVSHHQWCGQDGLGGCTCGDWFYGRRLTEHEQWLADDMRRLNPGQTISYRGGVTVTRALFGHWFYVQAGKDGYRAECDRISGAVHTRNLIVARERTTPMGGM